VTSLLLASALFRFNDDNFSVIRSVEKATLPRKGEQDQIPKAAWKLATTAAHHCSSSNWAALA
jgi:hypothetical protein